jgi:hypothetical protein
MVQPHGARSYAHRMTENLSTKIAEWLNDTGYPLEMRTLRMLSGMEDWEIRANEYVVDVSTGASREIDLNLFCISLDNPWNPLPVDIEINVVIECKTTSSPWVVLRRYARDDGNYPVATSGTPLLDLEGPTSIHWRRTQPGANSDAFVRAAGNYFSRFFPKYAEPGYAIIDGLKKPNSRDGSYDAVRQAVSSCINVAAPAYTTHSRFAFYWFFPVVVTSARLFDASLDAHTNSLTVCEVERTRVVVPCEATDQFQVEVMNEAALPSLIRDIETCPGVLAEFLGTCDSDLIEILGGKDFVIEARPTVIGHNK